MFQGKINNQDFVHIIARVESKLENWKEMILNELGRLMLANAVLNSFSSYEMQIQWYPQFICDYLDKVACRFFWKDSNNKALHLGSWEKMICHKKHGGLCTRIARHQNVALLGKLTWEMLNVINKLWVQLFQDIYLKDQVVLNST